MMEHTTVHTANVTIELFGTARIASGRKAIALTLPSNASAASLVVALAEKCPALVGVVLRDDLAGLLESYTLNLNGTEFVSDGCLRLRDGDTLLLFSSQAGG
ncbi:MAG: MoaD/ThiS family protein [Chloroflexi bacterium]|nr:MoaD/ThiS family protein [Chloroflexota bacterium]